MALQGAASVAPHGGRQPSWRPRTAHSRTSRSPALQGAELSGGSSSRGGGRPLWSAGGLLTRAGLPPSGEVGWFRGKVERFRGTGRPFWSAGGLLTRAGLPLSGEVGWFRGKVERFRGTGRPFWSAGGLLTRAGLPPSGEVGWFRGKVERFRGTGRPPWSGDGCLTRAARSGFEDLQRYPLGELPHFDEAQPPGVDSAALEKEHDREYE
jgi:hypothetical protein